MVKLEGDDRAAEKLRALESNKSIMKNALKEMNMRMKGMVRSTKLHGRAGNHIISNWHHIAISPVLPYVSSYVCVYLLGFWYIQQCTTRKDTMSFTAVLHPIVPAFVE